MGMEAQKREGGVSCWLGPLAASRPTAYPSTPSLSAALRVKSQHSFCRICFVRGLSPPFRSLELSKLWFRLEYLSEGGCVLEPRTQLVSLLFYFYFCNQNPLSPSCLVEARGQVFLFLSRYCEHSRCSLTYPVA